MTKHPTGHILIVDDESDIALILKLHLEEAGYLTSWAANGDAGLNMLHDNSYDLVLLDVRMPGISGAEVLRRLRADSFDPAVIMMTAHGSESLAVDCMKGGADDYVAKPFDIEDLMLRIERALENRRTLREKLQLEQEKEDFIFMLSHDMKNPITAVIGTIDIMREGRLGPVNIEQTDYLQSAIESCEEVVTMIDNLLDMQRFKSGRIQARISHINPCLLLADTVRSFTPAAERENITLTMADKASGLEIAVDSSIMIRVFANLIGNALKFTPDGGVISISCNSVENPDLHSIGIPAITVVPEALSTSNCLLRICVSDNGTGISTDDLSNIFERYVQSGNASRRSRGGAGLGLAFCKKAVESFNGCIWAESTEGAGSKFTILLPGHPGGCSCDTSTKEELA